MSVSLGNKLFQSGNYQDALAVYESVAAATPALRHMLEFNTQACKKRLSYRSGTTSGVSNPLSFIGSAKANDQETDTIKQAVDIALSPASISLKDAFLAWYSHYPIYFPPVESPEVSVIVPVFKGLKDLQNCLRSVALHIATEPTFEVILMDDCPTDQILWAIPNSGGLIKVSNQENLGFLRNCNKGAKVARGRYLCFLNTDTIVTAGWLGHLVAAFVDEPTLGIAGGMVLNDKGEIQEAGWRILGNGWGHPIGRNKTPEDPYYTYRRDVDCVTGACLMIERQTFDDLGGFDPIYAPAFYEEFDLSFRARARGLKTVYVPRSRILHIGSTSYGAEMRDSLSQRNHQVFCDRYSEILKKQPWGDADEFFLIDAGGPKPVVLVIDLAVPQPNRHAGDVTISQYLTLLAHAGWRVIFCPFDGVAVGPPADALERIGVMLLREPYTLKEWLEINGKNVNEVWIARPEIGHELIPLLRSYTSANISYYTHDLHHLRMEKESVLLESKELSDAAVQMKAKECNIFQSVDCVISPSSEEAILIENIVPGIPVVVVPPYYYESNELCSYDASHFLNKNDILFVGGFPHTPNVDAALFIANEVMPKVWAEHPESKLVIVGYAPPAEVLQLAGPRILVTGQVPSVVPYLAEARVMLVALRYGAGVKGKTIDALRRGVPVVSTSIGVEGIGVRHGIEALVYEDAQGLAKGVNSLLENAELCASLSLAGVTLIRSAYSRQVARKALQAIFVTRRCTICGSSSLREEKTNQSVRESFVCTNCFALARSESLSRVLLQRLARDGETSLAELVRANVGFRVHEFGYVGAIADVLRSTKWFSVSEYFDGVQPGEKSLNGVRCENITGLTFTSGSIDFAISQDVMEHVDNPMKGFQEIHRILRGGGSYIFTIPQNINLKNSVPRAIIDEFGTIKYLLPAEYHGDPLRMQGALVFTDFGSDLREIIESANLELVEHSFAWGSGSCQEIITVFEAKKQEDSSALICNNKNKFLSDSNISNLFNLQKSSNIFENLIEALYSKVVKPGDICIDGGANFGLHTFPLAKAVGKRGMVYAFEPIENLFNLLKNKGQHLPQVNLVCAAITNHLNGTAFHVVENEWELSSISNRYQNSQKLVNVIHVPTRTLDSLDIKGKVSFIKLDLEGGEYHALQGGMELLLRHRPIIVFECGRKLASQEAGFSGDEFFALFRGLRYRLEDIFGRPFGDNDFARAWDDRLVPHYLVASPIETMSLTDLLIDNAMSTLSKYEFCS